MLIPGNAASLDVFAMQEADRTGAATAVSTLTSAPSLSLRTTKDQSMVYGVGIESANAIAPTVGQNQILGHQWADRSAGVSFWMQNWTSATGPAGSTIRLNAQFPTTGLSNFVAVEVVSSDQ